jgi:hypothetical protein
LEQAQALADFLLAEPQQSIAFTELAFASLELCASCDAAAFM